MVIDSRVSGLIEVLETSGKAHDALIAKELSLLYHNRSPYIWTRVRYNHRFAPHPTPAPLNPVAILDTLELSSTPKASAEGSSPATTTPMATPPKFMDLLQEQDIIRTVVKSPPNTNHTIGIPWALTQRQEELSQEAKRPAKAWPFSMARYGRFRGSYRGGAFSVPQGRPHEQHQRPHQHQPHHQTQQPQQHHHHQHHQPQQLQQQRPRNEHTHRRGAFGNKGVKAGETATASQQPNGLQPTAKIEKAPAT